MTELRTPHLKESIRTQSQAQGTHKLPNTLGSREGQENRSWLALLASKLKKGLFWHADAEIFVSPFFYHPNSP